MQPLGNTNKSLSTEFAKNNADIQGEIAKKSKLFWKYYYFDYWQSGLTITDGFTELKQAQDSQILPDLVKYMYVCKVDTVSGNHRYDGDDGS